jgi:hypothetical protein
MTDIVALKAANARRLQVAKIAPKRQAEVSAVAVRLASPAASSGRVTISTRSQPLSRVGEGLPRSSGRRSGT